jgi:3-phenylpropionate/trans-cinnamate dioxygenase ferredoxin component
LKGSYNWETGKAIPLTGSSQLNISTLLDDPKGDKVDYVKVVDTSELPPNKMIIVVVGGKEVLLANVDGSYYAIANKCTHLGGSLATGVLEGSIITCPRHGARFDVKTGKAVGEAKIGFMKMKVKDEVGYTVKVEGTDILVGIPD